MIGFTVLCGVFLVATPPGRSVAQEPTETVVITATAPEEMAPPGTTVIPVEEARRTGARTIAEAIAAVPGIALQFSGSSYEPVLLRVRGSTSEQVLVLRDGRPITDSYSGIVDLARIPLDRVERIEITRGPVNALYGGGAAGMINIITAVPPGPDSVASSATPWSGHGRYSYGSFGEHRAAAGATFTGSALTLGLAAGGILAANSYDYDRAGASRTRENAGGREADLSLSADNHHRGALLEGDAALTLEGSRRGAPGSIEFPTTSAVVDDQRLALTLGAGIRPGPATSLRAEGDLQRLRRRFDDPEYPLGALESETDLRTAGGELAGTVEGGLLEAGVTFSGRYSVIDDLELGQVDRLTVAVAPRAAVETTTAVGGGWRLEGAGRIEYTDQRVVPSVRATLSWAPVETLRFGLIGATGYRLPTFLELFQPVGAFVVGNPNLDPERSASIEAEAMVTLGAPDRHAEIRAAAYLVGYEDLIQWLAGPDGRWSPRNTGTARVRGLEIESRFEIPIRLGQWKPRIDGRFELVQATDTTDGVTDGKQLPYRPRAAAGGGLVLAHPFGHSLGFDMEYLGARPVNAQNTDWLAPYLSIDASARARLPVGGVEEWYLFLRVTNLVDEPYVSTRYYPNPGREIVAGTEVRW